MRKLTDLLDTFMPLAEKEWSARLFTDEAVKGYTQVHLEVIARALCGKYDISLLKATNQPFECTEHIQGDCGKWIEKTEKFEWEASFGKWKVYGKNKTQIWLKIIDFFAGKQSLFPCA